MFALDNIVAILTCVLSLMIFFHTFQTFNLIEKTLFISPPKKALKITISAVFVLIYFFLNNYLFFFGITFAFSASIKYIYRQPVRINVLITSILTLHIMVSHILVFSTMSIHLGKSVFMLGNTEIYMSLTTIICMFVGISASMLASECLPFDKISFALSYIEQLNYTIVWLIICNIFVFFNFTSFAFSSSSSKVFVDNIVESLILILGVYIMFAYNIRINSLLSQKEKNRILVSQLENSTHFINAITKNYVRTYNINLSKNSIELINNSSPNLPYGTTFSIAIKEIADNSVYFEDIEKFNTFLNIDNLLNSFNAGNTKLDMNYRIKSNSIYRWCHMTLNIFKQKDTMDIMAVICIQDIHDEIISTQKLRKDAETDLMTGVYNRMTAETLISKELEKGNGVLLMIDIDNFKSVNDTFGHDTGDKAIIHLANILKESFRKDDIIGRYGGDEFIVYLKGITDINVIRPHLDNILKNGAQTIDENNTKHKTTISIGVAIINFPISFHDAFKKADSALYEKKLRGKNGIYIYDGE